ncbi:non-ribosomal peptide synthetase [Nostoc sp. NMS4]|uniref:non-ribosomal peptide synthetase n=1 Tax=Nostoc sp. NMS4 TaxID=2815390 RepID=UPI0025E12DE7|nr:non-ribosomal peptide synthetase [Nostoc sp. NMS4]MBN3925213.1 amino acid adenylation domain-containing protein [Nostoc sp. NMS4]
MNKDSQDKKIVSTLKYIVSESLGVKSSEIDIHTPFLAMGIDSLILLQINHAIQKDLGINIPFRLLLENLSTIHALATHITQELPPENTILEPEYQELTFSKILLQPHTETISYTPNFEQEEEKYVTATLLEQVIEQQLDLMSKQLDILQKASSWKKILPKAIPSIPIQHQVRQVDNNSGFPESSSSIQADPSQNVITNYLTPRQQKHLDALIARFVKLTPESKRLTQAYRSYHANSRAITGFLPSIKEMLYPIHGQRGEGARLWDVDGQEYVDISMGFGALLFGHSPSFVIEAIQEQIKQGILHGPQSRLAGQVAELICELTGAERAAFCNDGTEAVMGAIRLARATTRRSKIALFTGSYHGTYDGVLVRGVTTTEETRRSIPRAIGIPSYIADDAIALDYGKPESLEILKTHAHELAAVLVEPIQSSRPDLQPQEFLLQLRQLTQATGIVLIFDEVITGFRMHPGGIQGLWNIQADLTTYGKAVAAGMPIGVIAGKAALMDTLDGGMWNYGDESYPQAETTVFAGTFFKHPLVMAAAWAALNHIKNSGPKLQQELSEKTTKLAQILNSYFEQRQVPIKVVHFGSLFRFIASSPLKFGQLFFYHLLEKGVYVWEGRTFYLSTAHTDADIEHVIKAVKQSIVEMQQGELLPPAPISTTINIPLTAAQKELWFLAQMGDEVSRAYNESRIIHLRGSANVLAVCKAVQEIINRHEALRTTFSSEGDNQLIHSTLTIDIPLSDFSTLDKSQRETELSQLLTREAQQIFDLEKGLLLRCHIVKLQEDHHLVVLTNHHIVADGWSISILLRELAAIYSAECQGIVSQLPQPMKWSEYALWQLQMQQSPEMAKAEAYWLSQFANSVPILELPIDRPRPAIFTYTGAREHIILDASLYNSLKSLSLQRGYTLFTILLTAFITLLQRLTNQQDIVVGIASAGQSAIADEYLVGHCVNLLPIRSQVVGNPSFTDYLSSIQQVLLDAYEYQIYPFIKLVENLKLPRDRSRTPLFNTGFNLDKAQFESKSLKEEFEVAKNSPSATKLDINLNILQTDSKLVIELEYNTDLFDTKTIQRWLGNYVTLLEGVVTNPEQPLAELPILTQAQQHQLLVEWNNTQVDYPGEYCIHELFEAQVERSPDAIAVVFEDEQLTYRELNHRANQLAHYLRSLGVKPEVLVGICVERSLEMAIGLLGILKAGGAYLPLEPNWPQERLIDIFNNSHTNIVLTQEHLIKMLPLQTTKVVCLNSHNISLIKNNQKNPNIQVKANNLAYVMYTSGSTGKPKGVSIIHRNVVRLVKENNYAYLNADQVFLQLAPLAFDASIFEIWSSLLNGAKLVIMPLQKPSLQELGQTVKQHQVTILWLTANLFHLMVDEQLENLQSVRQLLAGGDVLSIYHVKKVLAKLKECQLINGYGPTENTTFTCCYSLNKNKIFASSIPIGRPIANTQIYILDTHLQLVPIGVAGELYTSGDGLARGYFNSSDLTAEKFIPHPWSSKSGSHLYKTGDLARYLPDGNIEFLGRIDHQVKIRGFRIELGEVEAAINQHLEVKEVKVIVIEDIPDNKRLVAYIVPNSTNISTLELRNLLKVKLPDYMIPSAFVVLEKLPLTLNGKIDRRALPKPDPIQQLEENIFPVLTPFQEILTGIWTEILGIKQVGIHDNFFELGGHSLLATRVISQIRKAFKVELPLRCLFESPTVAELAKEIEKTKKADLKVKLPNIGHTSRTSNIRLSYAQQRLWYLDQLNPHNAAYNIFDAVRIIGSLDIPALEQSLNEIIHRHEILRTNFILENGQPIQVIAPYLNLELLVIDLSKLLDVEKYQTVQNLVNQEAENPFNLDIDRLLRVTLLRLSETEYVLLFTMHHIIADGWSMGVLIKELVALYEAFSLDKPSPLPEIVIQYADFAIWQHQLLQEEVLEKLLTYWQKQLQNLPTLKLVTDYPRPIRPTYQGLAQPFILSLTLSQQIKILSNQQGVTLFMTLQAAFATLMHYYSQQDDIVIGTDIANRSQGETEALIGFFVNQLVLRTKFDGNPSFQEMLERVRAVTLDAYAHQDLPFDKLVEAINPQRNLHITPLFQVKLILQNTPTTALNISGLTFQSLETETKTATFDLLFDIRDTEHGLMGLLKYSTDLFAAKTIARMLEHFETILSQIVNEPTIKINELKEILAQTDKQDKLTQEITYQNSLQQKLTNIRRKSVK